MKKYTFKHLYWWFLEFLTCLWWDFVCSYPCYRISNGWICFSQVWSMTAGDDWECYIVWSVIVGIALLHIHIETYTLIAFILSQDFQVCNYGMSPPNSNRGYQKSCSYHKKVFSFRAKNAKHMFQPLALFV